MGFGDPNGDPFFKPGEIPQVSRDQSWMISIFGIAIMWCHDLEFF